MCVCVCVCVWIDEVCDCASLFLPADRVELLYIHRSVGVWDGRVEGWKEGGMEVWRDGRMHN